MVSSSYAGGVDQPSHQGTVEPGRYPWIVNPIVDFLFVYGGLVWICIAINLLILGWAVPTDANAGAPMSRALLIAVLLGQHFFADSHTAATYMRIYPGEESRQKFEFFTKYLPLALLPTFFYGLIAPGGAGDLIYLYLLLVFWHYAAQSFGISLIYCYKRGYMFKAWERESYRWFIYTMILFIFARMLTFRQYSPSSFFGVRCPFWGPLPEWVFDISHLAFIVTSVIFTVVLLKKFLREKKLPPHPAILIVSTVALIGFSQGTLNALCWMYGPAFFHGSQYIAVSMAYYLKERGLPEGAPPSAVAALFWKPSTFQYMGLIVLSGVFIYVGIPHFFQQIGYDFALVAAVCLAVFNFHHFATDAAIWRLRDPKQRQILLA